MKKIITPVLAAALVRCSIYRHLPSLHCLIFPNMQELHGLSKDLQMMIQMTERR